MIRILDKHKNRLQLMILFLGFFSLPGLWAQINSFSPSRTSIPKIPESYEIRQTMGDWIHASINEARSYIPGVFSQNTDGAFIKVGTRETEDFFYQLFLIQQDYSYPLARKGNYIIKRSRDDGSFIQVKIFLRNEEGSFIRIFPSQERAVMDVYLLGKKIYGNLVLPFSLSRIFTQPLGQILEMTSNRVEWSLFNEPSSGLRGEMLLPLIASLRDRLPDLNDTEDGAMDASGRFVFIDNLLPQPEEAGGFNCSGFAKWVVDGFVLPLEGRMLDISTLTEKHPDVRGNSWSRLSEEKRDPFFGLDWTRSLAVSLSELRNPTGRSTRSLPLSPESMDVRQVSFFPYLEDVGYPVSGLETVLYLLAQKNPDTFYLGSVNVPFGTGPVLRQHTHVVVLFPYFTSLGDFRVVVMERNRETDIPSLLSRYSGDFIHLVRVEASGTFELP